MSEWEKRTLGTCFDLVKVKCAPENRDPDDPYVGLEHIVPRTSRITKPGRAGGVSSLVGVFTHGDVLFGRLRPYLHKVAFADFDGVASTEVLILRARSEVVLPKFLYLLASGDECIRHAVAKSAGSRMPRTSVADLADFQFALPPIVEQRRIVDLIGSVDATIESLDKEHVWLGVIRDATLMDLQQVADGSVRTSLGEWVARSGGSIRTGPFGTLLKAEEYTSEGAPVISTGEVRNGHLRLREQTPRVDESVVKRLPMYLLEHGDIVFARKGAVDRSAWVKEGETGYFLGSDGLLIRSGGSPEESRFLSYLLQTPEVLNWLGVNATGTIMKGLNQKILSAIPIGVPNDDVRHDFVARMETLDAASDALVSEVSALRAFRATLLSTLLSQSASIPESYDALLEIAS